MIYDTLWTHIRIFILELVLKLWGSKYKHLLGRSPLSLHTGVGSSSTTLLQSEVWGPSRVWSSMGLHWLHWSRSVSAEKPDLLGVSRLHYVPLDHALRPSLKWLKIWPTKKGASDYFLRKIIRCFEYRYLRRAELDISGATQPGVCCSGSLATKIMMAKSTETVS